MPVTRAELIDCLEQGWGNYAQRLHSFAPEEQRACLLAQGYPTLSGLLGHVMLWWARALHLAPKMLADPHFQRPAVDVERFNADAIQQYGSRDEGEVVRAFDALRLELLAFVRQLPDSALDDERLNTLLENEITGHLEEHRLPE